MGAGASVSDDAERVAVDVAHRSSRAAHEAGELANASQTPTDNAFHDVADTSETIVHDVAQQSAAASSNVAGVTAEIVSKVGSKAVDEAKDAAAALLTLVPAEVIEPASALVSNVRHELSTEQLSEAAERLGDGLSKLTDSSAILVVVGSALAEVSGMAPAVIDVVGHALSGLGKHLGPIGVAAGFLGALVYTFQASKDQDKNVHTVMIWSASVKDWLLLVVQRVERSAAESTLPLFESLRSEMESMFRQIKKHNKRWRITKMLSSASFQRDFERAKTSVLELKGALKDFLNQEALDAQELKLKTITDTQLDVSTKLDTMDNQLAEIRAMLKVQADARDTATGDTANVNMDEEEQIYRQMQLAAGVEHDAPVKFKDFVVAFECFFFSGKDMDQETKRTSVILIVELICAYLFQLQAVSESQLTETVREKSTSLIGSSFFGNGSHRTCPWRLT